MTLWKAWSELKLRFYLCVILVTLMMAPGAITTAVMSARAAASETTDEELVQANQQASQAFDRLVEGWIRGSAHGIFAILATVLAVGGTMARSNSRSNLMTLSLPQKRSTWIFAQWVVASGLVIALSVWEAMIIVATAIVTGHDIPAATLAGAALLTGISAIVWTWPAILATSFTGDAVRAALVIVATIVAVSTFTTITGMLEWKLRHIADLRTWSETVPWKPLTAAVLMSVASAVLVLRRFDRTDY